MGRTVTTCRRRRWPRRAIASCTAHTDDYRADIERLARAGQSAEQIYEALAIEDVRAAAELLGPIYGASGGTDGFESLEVSPHLARDASATIAEAKRLWSALDRVNVMIKAVPYLKVTYRIGE